MEQDLRQFIRQVLAEQTYVTSRGNEVKYGSNAHIKDLEKSLDHLVRLRSRQSRSGQGPKNRHIYSQAVTALRKEISKARRHGLKNGLIRESKIRTIIQTILEGGLKAPELTSSTVLDPKTVAEAIDVYKKVLSMWNVYLESQGMAPVQDVSPVGSVAYFEKDLKSGSDVTYGDVDYLVAFPVAVPEGASPADARKAENRTSREYTAALVDFLNSSSEVSQLVNVPATVRTTPTLLIVKLPDGRHVQVDTIITYPHYVATDDQPGWMPGRWTPERGIKGYALGELYTTFGILFNLSISDRGVHTKTRDGKPVPFSQRKDTKLIEISRNFETFFRDIAEYLTGSEEVNPHLDVNPGMDPSNVSIVSAARGIKGVILTLADHGKIEDAQGTLDQIFNQYSAKLQSAIDRKRERGLTDEKYAKLQKVNQQAIDLVAKGFSE